MPYPVENTPRVIPAAFAPGESYAATPNSWDPYPRYIDQDEFMAKLARYTPVLVLTASAPVPPDTLAGTLILRRS